mgnify:CR=1 FL=1
MNLTPKKDYSWVWDEDRQMYVANISSSGEKVIERAIVRNAKEDKASAVSDDLAGAGWIPLEGTFNKDLDDGCGRFKVRHFGVATAKNFSSFSISAIRASISRCSSSAASYSMTP